jgi:adenine phosphoribosyltransferase
MCQLVENAGGTVAGVAFLIELTYLGGRDLLAPYDVVSLITYDDPDE